MISRTIFFALLFLFFALQSEAQDDKPIVATIRPVELILRAILPPNVPVALLLDPTSDPHLTELTPSAMELLLRSRAIVSINSLEINERLASFGESLIKLGPVNLPHGWLSVEGSKLLTNDAANKMCKLLPYQCKNILDRASEITASLDNSLQYCREKMSVLLTEDSLLVSTHGAWAIFGKEIGFKKTIDLFAARGETVVPSKLASLHAALNEKPSKKIFIADTDTQEGLKNYIKTDLSTPIVVLDESEAHAASLDRFFKENCDAIGNTL